MTEQEETGEQKLTEQDIRSYMKLLPPPTFEPFEVYNGVPLFRIPVPVLIEKSVMSPTTSEELEALKKQRKENGIVFIHALEERILSSQGGNFFHEWFYVGGAPQETTQKDKREYLRQVFGEGLVGEESRKRSIAKSGVWGHKSLEESLESAGFHMEWHRCNGKPYTREMIVAAYDLRAMKLSEDEERMGFFLEDPKKALRAVFLLEEKVMKEGVHYGC